MYRLSMEFALFMADVSSATTSSFTSDTNPLTADRNTPRHPETPPAAASE
jgi:hypothetical protein